MVRSSIALTVLASSASFSAVHGYAPARLHMSAPSPLNSNSIASSSSSRRGFVSKSIAFALGTTTASLVNTNSMNNNNLSTGGVANAVGPIKISLVNPTYTAAPCPKDKPIPGEKAMKGMRGLCVQVKAELAENSPKVWTRSIFSTPVVTLVCLFPLFTHALCSTQIHPTTPNNICKIIGARQSGSIRIRK